MAQSQWPRLFPGWCLTSVIPGFLSGALGLAAQGKCD